MRIALLAAVAALCLSVTVLAADAPAPTAAPVAPASTGTPPPLTDFLKRDAFGTIKLSPTGEFLAATVPLSDRTSLVIFRRADMKQTGHVTLPENSHVASFVWVNDHRILFSVARKFGELETPQGTGEIYGVNADGSGQGGPLIGMGQRAGDNRSHLKFAQIIDTLRGDDNNVLIAVASDSPYTEVDRMNVDSGSTIRVARAPVRHAEFLADAAGVVRFAWGAGDDRQVKTYYRAGADAPWEAINDEATTQRIVVPVGFSADGKTAFLQSEQAQGPDSIDAFDVQTKQREIAYRHPIASPESFLYSPDDHSLYAAIVQSGKPTVVYLDADNKYAKQLRAIQAGLPDAMVLPASYTRDDSLALYVAYSDRIPGDFYLYDRSKNQVAYIASKANWFKPEMLAEMKPITLTARDGLSLQGFLTVPRGSDGKNLPLVVNPHGGPFGPYDQWGYNPEVQLLASRGYAVLQLNFRGSGNYGRDFQHKGYKQWGGTMQDDLTDATKWAIAQGIANPHRICIYGASYGGYAALMGVAKEPNLYRCAIGYVGVYDMPVMYHEGDISQSRSGTNFLDETLGHDHLESISPDHLADRIVVPVMMVAGKEDQRAPAKHTELMRDALLRLHKPVDAKIYPGQGHGFYKLADRIDLYTRMLAFLDRNIGADAGKTATTPASH